jgi:hypothetical protein
MPDIPIVIGLREKLSGLDFWTIGSSDIPIAIELTKSIGLKSGDPSA